MYCHLLYSAWLGYVTTFETVYPCLPFKHTCLNTNDLLYATVTVFFARWTRWIFVPERRLWCDMWYMWYMWLWYENEPRIPVIPLSLGYLWYPLYLFYQAKLFGYTVILIFHLASLLLHLHCFALNEQKTLKEQKNKKNNNFLFLAFLSFKTPYQRTEPQNILFFILQLHNE